jgi:hypothetical protein
VHRAEANDVTDASASEHPPSGTQPEHGDMPAHRGTDPSDRLIKTGTALAAISTIGWGLLSALGLLSGCGTWFSCGPGDFLQAIAPAGLGVFVIWAGRRALRGTRSGLIGVALCGGAAGVYALFIAVSWVQSGNLDYYFWTGSLLQPEDLLFSLVVGLVGILLIVGAAGRHLESRRMKGPHI